MKMDSKDLLVNIMFALDGYSGRFERLENIKDMLQGISLQVNSSSNIMQKQYNETMQKMINISKMVDNIHVTMITDMAYRRIEESDESTDEVLDSLGDTLDMVKRIVDSKYDSNIEIDDEIAK